MNLQSIFWFCSFSTQQSNKTAIKDIFQNFSWSRIRDQTQLAYVKNHWSIFGQNTYYFAAFISMQSPFSFLTASKLWRSAVLEVDKLLLLLLGNFCKNYCEFHHFQILCRNTSATYRLLGPRSSDRPNQEFTESYRTE